MRPQKKRRGDQAPRDYKGMTWCIYLWGQKPKIITDALVLGESLKESGTRARMVACVDSSTLEVPMSVHLERFWEVMPVEPLDVPQGLVEAGMERLQGVYNKLQVWKLFDDERNPHWKSKRVCMLDCDMMIRQHADQIWSFQTPAAVMRGPTDSGPHVPRPVWTYDYSRSRYERGLENMRGGSNGGLVYFEPSAREFRMMYDYLCSGRWSAVAHMEEQ